MNEEFLSYLWKFQLLKQPLQSTEGEEILVKKQGTRNVDAGPDFSNALIKIGNALWSGNVEIHVKSSDWFKHKHQSDNKYQNVILHVVYEDDLQKTKEKLINIPTLELKNSFDLRLYDRYHSIINNMNWVPCEKLIHNINRFRFYFFMSRLAIERLEEKSIKIRDKLTLNKNNLEQTFYEQLARNFGFKTNGDAFESLARSLPLIYIAKHKNNLYQIEAMLFGQAGLLKQKFKDAYPRLLQKEYAFLKDKFKLRPLPAHIWKFSRLRPSNFPTIRISQFAMLIYLSSALLSQIMETEKLEQIRGFFKLSANDYWNDHFNFDKKSKTSTKHLGIQSSNLILINSVIPFLFVYGKLKGEEQYSQRALKFLESMGGEQNNIIRRWNKIGVNTNSAFFTQALMHLKSAYCDHKKCLDCHIGHELLKQ